MGYEVFKKSQAVMGRRPNVTVAARGLISINPSAYRLMGEPEYVDLLFDRDRNLVAIRPSDDEENGHKVRQAARSGSPAVVSGTAFMRYYGIDAPVSRRWEPKVEEGMLVIDLNEASRPTGRSRAAAEEDDDMP